MTSTRTFRQRAYFFFFKNLKAKQIFPIFILGMVDMFVFLGPLYLRNVFPNPQEFFNITKGDFDRMTSIWGYVAVCLYFPSGWLADKFSNRKLIMISSSTTAILVVWWTTLAMAGGGQGAMVQLGLIYGFWGVTTTLTFWAPLWRLLSQQVDKEDQGTAYGLQGSFNGLWGFIFVTIIGYFLLEFNPSFRAEAGFAIFGFFIAGILLLGTVLVWFFTTERPFKTDPESRFSWRKLWRILKSGRIWLAALMVNGIYFMQHELAYLVPYMKNIIGVTGLVTVLIAGGRTYAARTVISQPVGRIGDRAKSFILLLVIGLTVALIIVCVILFLPGLTGNFLGNNGASHVVGQTPDGSPIIEIDKNGFTKWVVFVQAMICIAIILLGILTWILVTLRFAMVAELPTPKNSYGTVVGFISLIAFSSNGWFNTVASVVQKKNPLHIYTGTDVNGIIKYTDAVNEHGSILIITILLSVAGIGALSGWILYIWTKRNNKNKKQFERIVNN